MTHVDLELYDIFDYYYIPFWQKTWFIISASVAAGLLVVGLIAFFYYRSRKKILAPWDWAYACIAKLDPNSCETQEDFKYLYYELTTIIKTYLARRYGWSTLEKTDEELMTLLEKKKFNTDLISLLKTITDNALGIKFANQSTLKSQANADIQAIKVMIEQTRQTQQ